MNRSKMIHAAVAAALLVGTADAATPIAVTSCDSCTSLTNLQARAQWFATNHPTSTGTIIFISGTSGSYPLSAFFKVNTTCSSGHCYRYVSGYQANGLAAAQLDELTFARSLKILPINIPAPATESDDWFDLYLQKELAYTGVKGGSPWGDIPGLPPSSWWQLKDEQTGQLIQAYPGQMIRANYNDGTSEKWQFIGVPEVGCPLNGPCQWQRVPHTHMDRNGKLLNPPPPPPPATPFPNFQLMNGTSSWSGGYITTAVNPYLCQGTSTITVTAEDGSSVISYGYFSVPCGN